ncbi:Uncharacterized protein APZ42_015637 [Daphnia magna]|uniref:Uncharacterized protein n=1 Tax=Daphnia magna TaxID=35525 RepID=A0A0P5EG22_9CRUS|nr:Uncharacterized protein APZ42_015637 [Daphnia magna]
MAFNKYTVSHSRVMTCFQCHLSFLLHHKTVNLFFLTHGLLTIIEGKKPSNTH